MTLDVFVIKHKPHSVYIEYKPHRSNYETVTEYLEHTPTECIEKQDCIDADTIWTIQVYPHTPIGFYSISALTLAGCVAEMDKCLSKKEEPCE